VTAHLTIEVHAFQPVPYIAAARRLAVMGLALLLGGIPPSLAQAQSAGPPADPTPMEQLNMANPEPTQAIAPANAPM